LKRVYISVFGSGLGHATRMMAVIQRLKREGFEVRCSSSEEATGYLRAHGVECNDIPLVDVVFTDNGNFSATDTMKVAPWLFMKVFGQTGIEARNMMRFRPDVVLSDSLASSLVASKLLGLPSVTVLNQTMLVSSPKTPPTLARLLSTGSITVVNEFWELSDRILFPDLPPPYTISEANLWSSGSVGARAEYVGFLTPPPQPGIDAETERLLRTEKKVLYWQVSGPAKTRGPFLRQVRRAAAALKGEYLSVVSAGNPNGSSSPSPIEGGYVYDWCRSKDALVDRCAAMVSRAGHVTLSDLILRGKPSVLVPIAAQSEQIGNASKAERLGVAVSITEEAFGIESLREGLARVEGDGMRSACDSMAAYARTFDAADAVVEALKL
jgi:UDP-N-acetylglucosamine--N-acetylmuramyl-(pentapeptide) pyrophosphoryl-undecaprenol N-acetylglucosamine transferase